MHGRGYYSDPNSVRPRKVSTKKSRKIISQITNYFHVTLRIIGRIFLRGIWHIDAHFNPNDHKASLRIDQLFSLLLLAPDRILTLLVR